MDTSSPTGNRGGSAPFSQASPLKPSQEHEAQSVVSHGLSSSTHDTAKPQPASRAAKVTQPRAAASTRNAVWASVIPTVAAFEDHKQMYPFRGAAPRQRNRVVHPQGFRILNNASVWERNMRGYFRLPQPPSKSTRNEQKRLQRTLQRIEKQEELRKTLVTGNEDGAVLDGFLLLSSCEAEEPEDVKEVTLQSSQLTDSVAEDLLYFTNLTSLDLSDNRLCLGDVLAFPRLEVVHLVCNGISSLADVPQSNSTSLPTVMALDLAYNRIPSHHVTHLHFFSSLQQLDLSHNALRALPMDLSCFVHLTHFALEDNLLASPDVFYALGTLPALLEVNLSGNRLSRVPPLDTLTASDNTAGATACDFFPTLQVVTLTANRFEHIDALIPLAALHHHLRRVAVGENPLSDRYAHRVAELQDAFDEAVANAYYAMFAGLAASEIPTGASQELQGTWHNHSWVRYVPPPHTGPDGDDDGAETSRSVEAADSLPLEASAPLPCPPPLPCPEATPPAHCGGPGESLEAPNADMLLTAEAYVAKYRIYVQNVPRSAPALPKQSTRYFYSTAFRETPQGVEDVVPLVTLPPYNEFMDVYRILGRHRPGPRQKHGGLSKGRSAPPLATPFSTSAFPTDTDHELPPQSGQEKDEDEDEEWETDAADVPEEEGFFITGIDGGSAASKAKERTARNRTAATPPLPPPPPPTASLKDDGPRSTCCLPAVASSTIIPRPRIPRSLVSPATTNVHAAVSELRAMLRKPLPALPYDIARSK